MGSWGTSSLEFFRWQVVWCVRKGIEEMDGSNDYGGVGGVGEESKRWVMADASGSQTCSASLHQGEEEV